MNLGRVFEYKVRFAAFFSRAEGIATRNPPADGGSIVSCWERVAVRCAAQVLQKYLDKRGEWFSVTRIP